MRGRVRFGDTGSPDILGILPGGKLLGVELKTASGKLSAEQSEWIARARAIGALIIVSCDLGDVLSQALAAVRSEGTRAKEHR